ncbi:MAG TPA: HAD family hydrolase [Solirubrobacteraceae bacterium]|nr:HAD family hydrolase [Solirubrobacteraceae bacterium]
MPPRLVASDLDGTLLRSDGTVDERTRQAIATAEAAGATVVFCTARPHRWLKPLAEYLFPTRPHHGLAVCANGAVLWDVHTESVIEAAPLEPAVARRLVALLEAELPGGTWAVERTGGFAHEPSYVPRWPVPADTLIDAVDALIDEPAVKLLLRHGRLSADDLLTRARAVGGHLAEFSHSSMNDALLEISATGVSKASGLARLCRRLGVEPDEVIAFGDMPNDLPMLAWAGRAVAVANAHPEVIAAADEVTASNDEAGVAQVLERLFG